MPPNARGHPGIGTLPNGCMNASEITVAVLGSSLKHSKCWQKKQQTFQPFSGKWVQPIACFLSKGNANADELTKLVLEATILLEKCNLLVDAVVTDGASWNRSMWTKFGVTEENPSAEHPCDHTRRLWFISDFPHLLKCMRNCQTPDGDIKLDHWQAIIDANKLKQLGIRAAHKLTQDHLNPNPWQKMNCRMAWEVT